MPFTDVRAFLLGPSSPDQSLDRESHSGCLLTEEDLHAVNRQPQNVDVMNSWSDMYGHAQQHANCQQQGLPANMLPLNDGILNQVMQPDFVGHNIACAPNQYSGGMMSTYDPPTILPEFLGVPTRILLTPETGPQPVYVNAKQYGAILRRRQSRAKEDARKKLIKNRKSYLHESCHQHALTRARSFGGRFTRRPEAVSLNNTAASGSSNRSRSEEPSETPRGESVNL